MALAIVQVLFSLTPAAIAPAFTIQVDEKVLAPRVFEKTK